MSDDTPPPPLPADEPPPQPTPARVARARPAAKTYAAVGIPTPEQIMQEEVMNNPLTRTVVAGVMGALKLLTKLAALLELSLTLHPRWRAGAGVRRLHGRVRAGESSATAPGAEPLTPPQTTEGPAGEKLPWREVARNTARNTRAKSWCGSQGDKQERG